MDAKRTADKYIERGGYVRGERKDRWSEDLRDVLSFIVWHEDGHMRGGVTAGEAFLAACRLLNLEAHEMRRILRDEPDQSVSPTKSK